MNKIRRLLTLFMSATFMLPLLCGCGNTGKAGTKDRRSSIDLLSFEPAAPDKLVLNAEGSCTPVLIRNYNETAADALGRTLPVSAETGLPKADKYVGLFYLIWHTEEEINRYGTGMRDVSKAYACDPDHPDLGSALTWGWWSEPEAGYFRSDDVWKIRRDMDLFSMAGVDFLYIDMTNGRIYEKEFTVFLDTLLAMRAEGQMTPYVVPWCNSHASLETEGDGVAEVYEKFYKNPKYDQLWFRWKGKPLVLIKQGNDGCLSCVYDEELNGYFTFRVSWIDTVYPQETAGQGANYKVWADCQLANFDEYVYGYCDDPGKAECVAIGAAGWCQAGRGKSGKLSGHEYLDRFLETKTMGEGLMLEECFQKVMANNPETQVLLISRWNEWMALLLGQHTFDFTVTEFGYMDTFNAEFTRDLEPMKGGYTDNYFYQMCSIIRRFKGVLPADAASGRQRIDLDGGFGQWQSVAPVFTDFAGDTLHRNSTDVTGTVEYVNTTGRNDLVESRMTADGGMVYAYVRTAEPITPRAGRNWMLLFIDADNDRATGWEGYDFVVNYDVISDDTTALCAYVDNIWQEVGTVAYRVSGNELMIALPRSLLGLTADSFTLNFHWTDNVTDIYDLASWFTTGDNAPDRRNNYSLTLNIPYDRSEETLLAPRDNGRILYMPALDLSVAAPATPSTPDAAATSALTRGLKVTSYKIAADYGKLPDFDKIAANALETRVFSGVSADLFGAGRRNFALRFEGYVNIPSDGEYVFELTADDCARLYIDGRPVAEVLYAADRPAASTSTATGKLRLARGFHEFRLEYAEVAGRNASLALAGEWEFWCEG